MGHREKNTTEQAPPAGVSGDNRDPGHSVRGGLDNFGPDYLALGDVTSPASRAANCRIADQSNESHVQDFDPPARFTISLTSRICLGPPWFAASIMASPTSRKVQKPPG
jgi:hypothetical protein